MSIIADTLARLQSKGVSPNPFGSPLTPNQKTDLSERRTGPEDRRKVSRVKIMIIGLGITLSLITVGGVSFWWGLTLVPEISRKVEARPDQTPPFSLDESAKEMETPLVSEALGASETPLEPKSQIRESQETIPRTPPPDEPKDPPILPKKNLKSKPTQSHQTTPTVPTSQNPSTGLTANVQKKKNQDRSSTKQSVKDQHERISLRMNGQAPPKVFLRPEHRLAKAKASIQKQQYHKAVELLKPLFASPPKEWEPWFWMGTAQLGLGNLKAAEMQFTEGLIRDGTVAHLWVQRAIVEQQQGKYVQATETLRQAELLAPELPEVQLNLGFSLEKQGFTKLALEHYHAFLSLTEGVSIYSSARKKVFNRALSLEKTLPAKPTV